MEQALNPAGAWPEPIRSAAAIQLPPLAEGEIYVGAIGDKNGELYHVVLLPGDNDDANWQAQMDWAKSIGGDLPNRIEQAMLFANFRDEFKREWYWSNQTDADYSAYAWYQYFTNGRQHSTTRPTSCALVPSADCPFDHSVISRTQ